jgi:hypothetical protein
VDKVDVSPVVELMAYLPWIPTEALGVDAAPAKEAFLPAQTLQSLSCLWRC